MTRHGSRELPRLTVGMVMVLLMSFWFLADIGLYMGSSLQVNPLEMV